MKTTTVSQLVDELGRFPGAEKWLTIIFAGWMLVIFACWVGFAVVLLTRTAVSAVLAVVIRRPRSRGIHQRQLVDGGLVGHATT
jgi:hypothetical protein